MSLAKSLAVLSILVLAGCGDDSYKMNCPNEDPAFIEKSVADYFARHQNA